MRKCRNRSCSNILPEGTHGSKKFCSPECAISRRKASQRKHCDVNTMCQDEFWEYELSNKILQTAWV